MSKSLNELQELAAEAFKFNKGEKTLLVTSDGQVFLEKNRNAAEYHAKKAGGKQPLTIHEMDKEEKEEVKLSAEDRIAAIELMDSVAEVEAALKEEKAKTVKAAGEKRIAELSA